MEGEGPRYPGSLIVAHAKQLWKQKLEERAQRRGARPSNASLQKLKEFAIRHEGTALFAVFAFGLIKLSLDVFMDHRCEELDSRCEIIDYLGSKCQLSMAKLQRLKEVQAIWMKEIPLACSRGELWRGKLQGLQAQLGDPAASVAFPPSMLRRGTVAAASSTVQLPHALAPDPLQRAPSPETHQVPIVVNIEPAPPRAPAAPIAADLPPAAACIPLPNATKKLSKAQQTPPEAQQDDGSVLQGSSSSSCSNATCNDADRRQSLDMNTSSSPVRGTGWLSKLWPLNRLAFPRYKHFNWAARSPDQDPSDHGVFLNPHATSPATSSAQASMGHVPPKASSTTSAAPCSAQATSDHATPVATSDTNNSGPERHNSATAVARLGRHQQGSNWREDANAIPTITASTATSPSTSLPATAAAATCPSIGVPAVRLPKAFNEGNSTDNTHAVHLDPALAACSRSSDGLEHWEAVRSALMAKAQSLQHQWELELIELFKLQAQYLWWTRYQGRTHIAGLAIKVSKDGEGEDLSLAVKLFLGGTQVFGTSGQEDRGLVLFETGRCKSVDYRRCNDCVACGDDDGDTGSRKMCSQVEQASAGCHLGSSVLQMEGQKGMGSSQSGRGIRSEDTGTGCTGIEQDRCVSPANHRRRGSSWQLLINLYTPQVEASKDPE